MSRSRKVSPNKILLVVCIAAFMVPFMGSAINLALPMISEQFSMKAVSLTWISTAYLISAAVFQVPFARLADLIGRKKIFLLGIMIFSVSSYLCGVASSGGYLIAFRALTGVGSAMIFGTNMAILTSVFPKNKRGKALGINAAVVYAAIAVGPLFGGLLTDYFGWKSIFFVATVIGFITVFLAIFFIDKEWIEAKGEKFDWVGAIMYGASLFGLIYGFSKLPGWTGFLWLCVGVIGFAVFAFVEYREKYPVFNLQLFKGNRVFLFSSLAALINYAATFAISFMLSLYLQFVKGFTPRHAGMILVSSAIVQSFCTYFAGKLSDKISPFRLATFGMTIIVAGLAGLLFLTISTPVYVIVILLIFLGMGFGIFSSPNTNIIMSSVDKKNYGQASAATGTVRLVGQSFSMGIAAMAIALQVGNHKITPDLHYPFMESLRITFAVFLILCLIGVYASTVSGKSKRL